MKPEFISNATLHEILYSDELWLFKKTRDLDIDTLDSYIVPDHLVGYSDSPDKTTLKFKITENLEQFNMAMDTIILLNNGVRVGYCYITPITPTRAIALVIDIRYDLVEVKEDLQILFDITTRGINQYEIGNRLDNRSNFYSNDYLRSAIAEKVSDFAEKGMKYIEGQIVVDNKEFDYLSLIRPLLNQFQAIEGATGFDIFQVGYSSENPKIYWSYFVNDILYVMCNQNLILSYNRSIAKVYLMDKVYSGYLFLVNDTYMVLHRNRTYDLYHLKTGAKNSFSDSTVYFRMNEGKLIMINLTSSIVYDKSITQLTRLLLTRYNTSYKFLNVFNNLMIVGQSVNVNDENTLKFGNTFIMTPNGLINLNRSITIPKHPVKPNQGNFDFLSRDFIINRTDMIFMLKSSNYQAKAFNVINTLEFMAGLSQEGLGDRRLVTLRSKLLAVDDNSISIY